MAINNLKGDIPQEICRLKSLTFVTLDINKLSGTIPSCLYNMSSLTVISVAINHFYGSLPPNMFHTLPNLQIFYIDGNRISGPIPPSITNASILSILHIDDNYFTGQVSSMGKLQYLYHLEFSNNNLGDNSTNDLEFLKSLTSCSHLPNSLGNLSTQLSQLYLGSNQILGKIPLAIGNLVDLILLTIYNNHIDDIIQTTFGKFQNIQVLDLSENKLSGEIVAFIGNPTQLFFFNVAENLLEGNIPPSIGSIPSSLATLKSLQHLDLSRLSGSIPNVLQNIFFLEYFSVSFNLLDGEVPTKGVFQNASGFVVTSTLIFVEVFQNYIYHHALSKILHPSLIPKQGKAIIEEENTCILAPTIGKCLVSVFKIGLACSAESPKERMNTVDVTRELSKIRKVFYPGKGPRERSPHLGTLGTMSNGFRLSWH
ncbi:hypothetical protein JHK86_000923 [Glycine max]|nr:hypothetical protein JHK86_000923 [Glycine max]